MQAEDNRVFPISYEAKRVGLQGFRVSGPTALATKAFIQAVFASHECADDSETSV
jgi:hypothetical protein